MIWECFCNNRLLVEDTLNFVRYIELLEEHLLSFLNKLSIKDYNFQDDNASCHVSNATKSWKRNNSIKILPWSVI
jgi:hypothetical protein